MRTFKRIITLFLTLVLTVLILSYILINLFSSTILNENYVFAKLEETDYYNETYKLVESNFENYVQQSGLDEDVIKNIVTEEKIEEDTKKILHNLYDGLNEEISTKEIEENLNKNIKKSLGDRVNNEEKIALNDFVNKMCDEYKSTILHTNYEDKISDIYSKIMKYIKMVQKILIISIGVLAIIIILMHTRRIYKAITILGISSISSGGILIIFNIYTITEIKIKTITLLNDIISTTLRNILHEILNNAMTYGVILVVTGLVAIVVSNLIHNIKKYGFEEK